MASEWNPLHILSSNGWKWLHYEKDRLSTTDEYAQFAMDILGDMYHSTVVAIVSEHPQDLDLDGHYGILWLEAVYECNRKGCLSYDDMEDMQAAIILAEENLLKIGMPFTPGYRFHGGNIANKKRRNDKLRRIYTLEEIEARDNEKR